MKIGFYQFAPVLGKKQVNLKKIESTLSKVSADLIVLPELCNSGYMFQSRAELGKMAEPIPEGETTQFFLNIAKEKNFFLVAGLAERKGKNIYNSAVFVSPQGKVEVYRKGHLFCEEKLIFQPGNTRYNVYDCRKVKIGIIICFDYIFPEAIRSLALKGAQIICHPANLILPYGERVTIVRAIENRVFLIMANRTGIESRGHKQLKFIGRSQIVSPTGEILVKAKTNEETVKIVDIDPKEALNKYVTPYNNIISDRRPNLYSLE
ncbi:MAG: acyltransferase [candidate division WOR-3 bacterium]|nr:acyltransferase [candidate division WOR-3 bacterium]